MKLIWLGVGVSFKRETPTLGQNLDLGGLQLHTPGYYYYYGLSCHLTHHRLFLPQAFFTFINPITLFHCLLQLLLNFVYSVAKPRKWVLYHKLVRGQVWSMPCFSSQNLLNHFQISTDLFTENQGAVYEMSDVLCLQLLGW